MKKYPARPGLAHHGLLFALVLIAGSGFTSARAADSCSTLVLTNASGSPPVITGTNVEFNMWGFAGLASILLDGNVVEYFANSALPPDQLVIYPGGIPGVGYGSHTLQSGYDPDGCIVTFSNVAPPPPPPPPPAAPTLTDAGDGIACPQDLLEWNAPAGATSYQIWGREIHPTLESSSHLVWSGTVTHLTVGVSRNWQYTYQAAACNANGCSAPGNGIAVTGGICR